MVSPQAVGAEWLTGQSCDFRILHPQWPCTAVPDIASAVAVYCRAAHVAVCFTWSDLVPYCDVSAAAVGGFQNCRQDTSQQVNAADQYEHARGWVLRRLLWQPEAAPLAAAAAS